MPLRVKLTIRDEPMVIEDDEVETLRSQGLLDGEPEPVEAHQPQPAKPAPPTPAPFKPTED